MAEPRWVPQRVPPTGAITSEGIRNQLGRPRFDRLTVLVRESAQNSCDAALPDHHDPVRFEVAHSSVAGPRADGWQVLVRDGAAGGVPVGALRDGRSPLHLLCISDRGTTGLGGVTRADLVDEERDDYVAFVLNVGEPRDKELGGGTYGFGKAVFFTTSSVSTVVVYTRLRLESGEAESRLIGIALGHSYSADGRNFTGRHWWGIPSDDGVAPLLNGDADRMAASLGLPEFGDEETGTSVAMVEPELDGRTPEEAMQWVASAMGWHLWPKMLIGDRGVPEMAFRVTCDGEEIPVPSPETHPALAAFAQAYRLQRAENSRMLACGKPIQDLGRLGLYRSFEPPPLLDAVAVEAGMADGLHHVALMRAVNLVVRYEPGPPIAHEQVWYTGVFKPKLELDNTFAQAEPPTHDDWVADQLTGHEKTFVGVALRRLREALVVYASPRAAEAEDAESFALGAASHRFAGLLARASSLAPSVVGAEPTTPGPGRRYRLVGVPRFEQLDGETVLVQDVEVKPGRVTVLEPKVEVGLWGGFKETDPPLGLGQPRFRCWLGPGGTAVTQSALALATDDTGIWRIVVTPAAEASTSITVKGQSK
jgi:hypothetical protein